ncbi:hypothetical protein J6590_002381 [Homalodisca vitripennis]|nr:hypothetical protein J6590_002381 [Homalodisca vitripennis]
MTESHSDIGCTVVGCVVSDLWTRKMFQGHFRCECGKSYKQKRNLQRHKNYECNQERRFHCLSCQKKFKFKQHAQEHIKLVHKVDSSEVDSYLGGR